MVLTSAVVRIIIILSEMLMEQPKLKTVDWIMKLIRQETRWEYEKQNHAFKIQFDDSLTHQEEYLLYL